MYRQRKLLLCRPGVPQAASLKRRAPSLLWFGSMISISSPESIACEGIVFATCLNMIDPLLEEVASGRVSIRSRSRVNKYGGAGDEWTVSWMHPSAHASARNLWRGIDSSVVFEDCRPCDLIVGAGGTAIGCSVVRHFSLRAKRKRNVTLPSCTVPLECFAVAIQVYSSIEGRHVSV